MKQNDEDGLCEVCSKFDLFDLFTGPRHSFDDKYSCTELDVDVGTLHHVLESQTCPLCRLIKHGIMGASDKAHLLWRGEDQPNPSRVQFSLRPQRADVFEDSRYENTKTRHRVATCVQVCMRRSDGSRSSKEASDLTNDEMRNFCSLKLLSPESIDPSRPLLNGYRATTHARSLELLSGWVETCTRSHGNTCGLPNWERPRLEPLRLIDVDSLAVVVKDPTSSSYAALSYVWGKETKDYLKFADEIKVDSDGSVFLPSPAPQIIEDAIEVCKRLGIPYLWADLYCVNQHDPKEKEADINNMGLIYQNSLITLIGAGGNSWAERTGRLLHRNLEDAISPRQVVETIRGKKYITSIKPLSIQILESHWNRRGWTYQEGALPRRIAFFGGLDVSFQCAAGHWRESLHSGPYSHDANITRLSDLDVRSKARNTLSVHRWLKKTKWNFFGYRNMLFTYTRRELSYEADRINAVSGCLKMLGQRKGLQFMWGLPSIDFHYALLWRGEYDRPRPGFPSWSWAGWHARQTAFETVPAHGSSGGLTDDGNGKLIMSIPPTAEIKLAFSGTPERKVVLTRCQQTVSDLDVQGQVITIRAEVAHFLFDLCEDPSKRDGAQAKDDWEGGPLGSNGDEDSETLFTSNIWDRVRINDSDGNQCQFERPYHLESLRRSTLDRLKRDGLDLVKIIEVNCSRPGEGAETLHRVLCLGLDRSGQEYGRCRRYGSYVLSGEVWSRGSPKKETIELI